MRRLPCSFLVLFLSSGLVLLGLPRAHAADEKKAAAEETVRFETADSVELKGTFFPSERGKKAPCVILLHKLAGNSQDEGWDSLAQELQAKGFAVLAFDFRGHGSSTTIKNPVRFWSVPTNRQMVRGFVANARQPKDTLGYKDFSPTYYTTLVNDIAAAKLFLDTRKNDNGDCDSAATILVGAQDGATLGALWMTSEWYRRRVIPSGLPNVPPKLDPSPEGKEVVCAVWLSMTSSLHRAVSVPAHEWVTFLGRSKKVPMAFFYGDQDNRAENFAKKSIADIRPDKNNAYTIDHAVKGTTLAGSKLLSSGLDAQADIVRYLEGLGEDRGMPDWQKKDAKKNSYVWLRPMPTQAAHSAGARIPAKAAEEDMLHSVPLTQLGLVR
jgi:pimeloyl-ACP methyl ester carboxylesterase